MSPTTSSPPALSMPLTTSVPPPPVQPRTPRAPIRITILCDGTAQARDSVKTALSTTKHSSSSEDQPTGTFFTNVALLAKCIASSSSFESPSMPQLVFYQSGVGTGTGWLQNLFDQGTGFALGSKIEQAYGFLVDNYQPGDELFFFGFSRGAYTARCITGFINWCGVLGKVEMTHFAEIWAAYQKRDPDDIDSEREAAKVLYAATLRWPSVESETLATNMFLYDLEHGDKYKQMSAHDKEALAQRRREECARRRKGMTVVPPQIKVVGVWDTVSALGLPGMFQDNVMIDFFDFYDPGLGSNVQFGFHALSLEEDRKDFLPTMWYQPTSSSNRSRQLLKQCWFQGVHTDVGGGYQYHGLSDLTLIWMVSQLVDPHTLPDGSTTLRPLLNIDLPLLATILDRRREWGMQPSHRSRPTVNYQRPRTVCARHPSTISDVVWETLAKTAKTHESIHPSVYRGGRIDPATHVAFADLRTYDAAGLDKMWEDAKDWQRTLGPTERLLYWDRRGPYPWIPTQGDVLNPTLAPLMITGGWNIPSMTRGTNAQTIVDAATAMGDVDDAPATHESAPTSPAGQGDVDDQPADGWEQTTDSSTTKIPTPPLPIAALPTATLAVPSTHPPEQVYPLIPSKELGENPVDPTAHPHLRTLWQGVYHALSTPNALVADVCNLGLVTRANLNQTAAQGLWWSIGDKVAGYKDEVKVQALTAGLGKMRAKGKGTKVKGFRNKGSGGEGAKQGEEESVGKIGE
ncbi:protein of unknown function DUF2235 [Kalmanozyma brasiliensis GHG001]|uniref:T6SS Phospholipase effector Tle1-like catalytic domain-containing protein n=1 Tax=Kalmanozyma brasiliensis (strain GHG001) TaxID=1365824 RepID=V5EPY1_KALBG|nr:protein of unknown function DUF2235 [Kalmanozyma brasiliensis GHG001]EST07160.1 protein of unknown function DUF2235 [Kalmanozyma brasiliensis GHG001]